MRGWAAQAEPYFPRPGYDSQPMNELSRITSDPKVMGGKPCIRGMRVTVGTIVGLVATGHPHDEIRQLYPYVEEEDILQALSSCSVAVRRD